MFEKLRLFLRRFNMSEKTISKSQPTLRKIQVPILSGTYSDLTVYDFSFKDISIYDIESKGFEAYIENLQPDYKEQNLNFVKHLQDKVHFSHDKKYAIVKNNPRNNYNFQDLINIWKLLIIIYPSDLQIEYIIEFSEYNGIISNASMASWTKRITGDYPGDLLIALEENVPEINEFAKVYFERLNLDNYIGVAIENYLTSFTATHIHYKYLTLCISLESTIYGSQELTYRLRRNIAILCGKDIINCEIIYENLNKLYSLRSKIVHGEPVSISRVNEYMKPLMAIVSRSIIELIIHNIPNNEKLNESITKLGFGDRDKISEKWKLYKLNSVTIGDSNWKRLK